MSATIEIDRFVKYFDKKAPVLTIPGRVFPVEVCYSKRPEPDYVAAAIWTAVDIHINEPDGDILIFLTGEEEIDKAVNWILLEVNSWDEYIKSVEVLPLYGSMSTEN